MAKTPRTARTSNGGFRPSRRTALGGLLAAGLWGLTGCDPIRALVDGETAPLSASGPGVTMDALTTPSEFMAKDPVVVAHACIPPGTKRPMGLAHLTSSGFERTGGVLTVKDEAPREFPVDPAAEDIRDLTDGGDAQILVEHPDGSDLVHDLMTSADLDTWHTEPLGTVFRGYVLAAGPGLVVGKRTADGIPVWSVRPGDAGEASGGADGNDEDSAASDGGGQEVAVTELGTCPVPEGEFWVIQGVARSGDHLVMLGTRPVRDVGTVVPFTVHSGDGGATWDQAVDLPFEEDRDGAARNIVVHQGTFVVMGWTEQGAAPYANNDGTYRAPHSWTSHDGAAFRAQRVPTPTAGVDDGIITDSRTGKKVGEIEKDTPVIWDSYDAGTPTLSLDGERLELLVLREDGYAISTRSVEGRWTTHNPHAFGRLAVDAGMTHDGAAVLMGPEGLFTCQDGSTVIHPVQEAEARADFEIAGSEGTAAGWGAVSRSHRSLDERGGEFRSDWNASTTVNAFTISADGLSAAKTPVNPADLDPWGLYTAPDGLLMLSGTLKNDKGKDARKNIVYTRADGGKWTKGKGLPKDGIVDRSTLTKIEDTYYLCGRVRTTDHDDEEKIHGEIWTSKDGRTWHATGGFPQGSTISDLLKTPDGVIAVGTRKDTKGDHHRTLPFAQRLVDDAWEELPVDGLPADCSLTDARMIGEAVRVGGYPFPGAEAAARRIEWQLGEDGFEEVYRADPASERKAALVLDEEGEHLLAPGWVDDPELGHGDAVFASADGGRSWGVTVVPGQECRFDGVSLVRDGDHVVVVTDAPEGPRGNVIRDALASLTD